MGEGAGGCRVMSLLLGVGRAKARLSHATRKRSILTRRSSFLVLGRHGFYGPRRGTTRQLLCVGADNPCRSRRPGSPPEPTRRGDASQRSAYASCAHDRSGPTGVGARGRRPGFPPGGRTPRAAGGDPPPAASPASIQARSRPARGPPRPGFLRGRIPWRAASSACRMCTRLTSSPPTIAARPGHPTLVLYAHHDVQPPLRVEAWRTPPFVPTRIGRRLYGRGAADDKGGIAVHAASSWAWNRTWPASRRSTSRCWWKARRRSPRITSASSWTPTTRSWATIASSSPICRTPTPACPRSAHQPAWPGGARARAARCACAAPLRDVGRRGRGSGPGVVQAHRLAHRRARRPSPCPVCARGGATALGCGGARPCPVGIRPRAHRRAGAAAASRRCLRDGPTFYRRPVARAGGVGECRSRPARAAPPGMWSWAQTWARIGVRIVPDMDPGCTATAGDRASAGAHAAPRWSCPSPPSASATAGSTRPDHPVSSSPTRPWPAATAGRRWRWAAARRFPSSGSSPRGSAGSRPCCWGWSGSRSAVRIRRTSPVDLDDLRFSAIRAQAVLFALIAGSGSEAGAGASPPRPPASRWSVHARHQAASRSRPAATSAASTAGCGTASLLRACRREAVARTPVWTDASSRDGTCPTRSRHPQPAAPSSACARTPRPCAEVALHAAQLAGCRRWDRLQRHPGGA